MNKQEKEYIEPEVLDKDFRVSGDEKIFDYNQRTNKLKLKLTSKNKVVLVFSVFVFLVIFLVILILFFSFLPFILGGFLVIFLIGGLFNLFLK